MIDGNRKDADEMRITNNLTALNSQRQQGVNNNSVSKAAEKLSSGSRINKAADDAAGLAISEKMRTQIIGALTASRNSQDAISLIQVAEGGLQSIHGMLQRQRELAVQSASDTNQDAVDREAMQQEFGQIVNEIDNVTNTLDFNGTKVLDGSAGAITIQAGANSDDTIEIDINSMKAGDLLGYEGDYNESTDVNIASSAAATAALDTLSSAVNNVSMQRAELGAIQNRLEYRMQNLSIQAENAAAAESRIRDADMAKTMTEFTTKNILQRASTAMLAQANALPQGVLRLLG